MRRENWIKWELSSRQDPGTKWFLSHYQDKARAYGFFLWIVEVLNQTNDGWIELDQIFAVGLGSEIGWKPDEVIEAITKLIEAKLFLLQDGKFASKKALEGFREASKVSQARAEAGRKGGIKSGTSRASGSKTKQNEANEADKIRSDKKSIYIIDLPCIKLTQDQFNELVLNHFYGDVQKAKELCKAANLVLKKDGRPVPEDCLAYLENFKRLETQFQKGRNYAPKESYKKPEQAPPRPQPPIFVPPKHEEHTPEQRAKNIQALRSLTNKTMEKVGI